MRSAYYSDLCSKFMIENTILKMEYAEVRVFSISDKVDKYDKETYCLNLDPICCAERFLKVIPSVLWVFLSFVTEPDHVMPP